MFQPKRVYFEPTALEYPLGKELYEKFKALNVEIKDTGSHNRVTGIPGNSPTEGYLEAKNTLVVGVRKGKEFQTCKPSAHYQLPLVTSCPGKCQYCYLATTLGKKPYIRVYVNVDEILERTKEYIEEKNPEVTLFEGAATSDPIPVEPYTGSLKKTIEFFAKETTARFRFVTKFTDVDTLLNLDHNKHTRFRFSINTKPVIKGFEAGTPHLLERLGAAQKVWNSDYPLGFIIAPIIMTDNWQLDYEELFKIISQRIVTNKNQDLTLELITHRFTKKAKNQILEIFPNSKLPMDEEERRFKYGQFGYGKYVYSKEQMQEAKLFMEGLVDKYLPFAKVDYFI